MSRSRIAARVSGYVYHLSLSIEIVTDWVLYCVMVIVAERDNGVEG